MIVSIGANDIGFGNVVSFSSNILGGGDRTVPPSLVGQNGATSVDVDDDCMNKAPPEPGPNAPPLLNPINPFDQRGLTMGRITQARLARLNCSRPPALTINKQPACTGGGLYGQLAQGFKNLGIAPKRVFISEYFDPTHDAQGRICDTIAGNLPLYFTGGGWIGSRKATWASAAVVEHGLNTAVPTSAHRWEWNVVTGIASAYRTHGYCAGPTRWVVTVREAVLLGNRDGSLHPNPSGHQYEGERVFDSLKERLYEDGKPVGLPK